MTENSYMDIKTRENAEISALKMIRDEMHLYLNRITDFTRDELNYIIIGFGLIIAGRAINPLFTNLLLMVPFIGYIYEILVINQKARIHRVACFVKGEKRFDETVLREWEVFREKRPCFLAPLAYLTINLLVLLAVWYLLPATGNCTGICHIVLYPATKVTMFVFIILLWLFHTFIELFCNTIWKIFNKIRETLGKNLE